VGYLPMETTKMPAEETKGGVACSRQHREGGEAKFLEATMRCNHVCQSRSFLVIAYCNRELA